MESADIIEPFSLFASSMDRWVFPTAVGPVNINNGFFTPITYTIRLNFFSSS